MFLETVGAMFIGILFQLVGRPDKRKNVADTNINKFRVYFSISTQSCADLTFML